LSKTSKNIVQALKKRNFDSHSFPKLQGKQFTLKYIKTNGFDTPILFDKNEDLGMTMPNENITVRQIAKQVGNRPIEIMDVATQEPLEGWSMNDWSEYFSRKDQRDRVLNVISLEISDTEFGKSIIRPKIVTELDWIDNVSIAHVLISELAVFR
jgi:F-box and leucine-rich repeat protein 10/11